MDELTEIIDNEVKLASYTYHPDGSMASMSQLNGLYTQYTYDANKNLSGLEVTLEGKALVKNAYTYDGNGNRLEKQQLNGTTSYQYDDLNRLTKVMYPNYSEELYYDQVGNRSKRIASGIEELYNYDVRNRLTSLTMNSESGSKTIQYAYDNQGNLLVDDKARYTYDGFNRTEKVETFDGNVQINHYDAEGLRHEIEENGKLVQFIFNTNREVAVEKSETDTLRLIRGYDITASESEQARTYYHYVSDELGSTTHIFEGNKLCNSYEYDAFGNSIASEEQVANRFKYTGQQHDPITQQYYLRARYYNPVIARFTQEDVYRGDGLNLYAYCDNNPVIYFDPSGYSVCPIKKALYNEIRKTIDPETGQPYTAKKAYELACKKSSEGGKESVVTLPEYDGTTTHGKLVLDDGSQISFTSGNGDPRYTNYANNGHVEQKASLYMRDNNSSNATLYHNNTNGTCGFCNNMTPTFLPEGASLTVIPPSNAVPNNSRAIAVPKTYIGNDKVPKVSNKYKGD